jgi:hypothetical protein
MREGTGNAFNRFMAEFHIPKEFRRWEIVPLRESDMYELYENWRGPAAFPEKLFDDV